MSDAEAFRIWLDADGEVWIEDPHVDLLSLARRLDPTFAWSPPRPVDLTNRLAATRNRRIPGPWPEDVAGLWALHETSVRSAGATEDPGGGGSRTLLDLKRLLVERSIAPCVLCEHRCGVHRLAGERGRCGLGAASHFAPAYVHEAEEREIAPSLCIPLTGCSWHCLYCHTPDLINRVDQGSRLDQASFAGLTARATAPGVRTVSFVGGNPDQHLRDILTWLAATPSGFDRPLVWNSNMYGSPELYRLLDGIVDVHVGDLRYGNDGCAHRLSGIERCWEPVTRNWELARASGALMVARVLLLPGHHECCTVPILTHLAEASPEVLVSLLPQYHPAYRVAREAPDMARRPAPAEIEAAELLVSTLGLRRALPTEGAAC